MSANDVHINALPLSIRTSNALIAGGIDTVGKLFKTSQSQLMELPNFGASCLLDVGRCLHSYAVGEPVIWYPFDQLTGTERRVCADIEKRQQLGFKKYGVTVEKSNLTLRQWLQHSYEETLDNAVYLKRAMEEMDRSSDDGK